MRTISRTSQMPRRIFDRGQVMDCESDRSMQPQTQPMEDLDLMIANGWGDTPQHRLPPDWRTRTLPINPKKGRTGPKGPTEYPQS